MTPRQLKAFTAVAQTLSFARACERLHMSQPAISLAISSLEEALGGRLLTRTTRQLAAARMELRAALKCHQLATVGQFVAAGLGVSVVPSLCEPQVSAMGARCLRLSSPSIRMPVGLITRPDQQLSTAAGVISAAMRESFGRSAPKPRIAR